MGEATGSVGARSWWGQVWSRPGGHRREWAGVQQPHWAASGCLARPLLSSQCRGALSSRLGALSPTVASLRLRAMQSVLNRISILGPPPGPPRPITSHLSCISIGGSEADMPPGAPSSLPTCCSAVFLSHGGAPSCQPWVGVGSVSSPLPRLDRANLLGCHSLHSGPTRGSCHRPAWMAGSAPLLLSLPPPWP